ncbi:MAG: hypothetical protein EOP48_08730 [Sphingobacteriales bacterium]|nr:MAG: hypothetical protein EOP48_08730 [Sphingobacteriales bacterium]
MSQVQKPIGTSAAELIRNDLPESFFPKIKHAIPATTFSETCIAMDTPIPIAILNPLSAVAEFVHMSMAYATSTSRFIPKNFFNIN